MTNLEQKIAEMRLETARGELRQAAVDFAGLIGEDYDEDAYVNAISRLEVAAEKFAVVKRAYPSTENPSQPKPGGANQNQV